MTFHTLFLFLIFKKHTLATYSTVICLVRSPTCTTFYHVMFYCHQIFLCAAGTNCPMWSFIWSHQQVPCSLLRKHQPTRPNCFDPPMLSEKHLGSICKTSNWESGDKNLEPSEGFHIEYLRTLWRGQLGYFWYRDILGTCEGNKPFTTPIVNS